MRKPVRTICAAFLALTLILSAGVCASAGGMTTARYDKNGASIPRDPGTGRDFVWYVDLGSGTWEVDGHVITAKRGGRPVSGVLDVHYNDNILLDGLIDSGAFAYLVTSDGSKIQLSQSGDGEVAVGRHIPEDAYIPFKVSLVVERPGSSGPGGEAADPYKVDFGSGSWNVDGKETYVTVNGSRASGTLELEETDVIKVHSEDRSIIQVWLYADGFSIRLELNGDDEVSVSRTDPPGTGVPKQVRFEIEKRPDAPDEQTPPDGGPGQGGSDPAGQDPDANAPDKQGPDSSGQNGSGPGQNDPAPDGAEAEDISKRTFPVVPVVIGAAVVIAAVCALALKKKKSS